jgi:micrococcal nuclease
MEANMIADWVAQGVRLVAYAAGLGLVAAGGMTAMRATAAAPATGCAIPSGNQVQVAEVLGGGALKLADGRKVLLSGIDVPRKKGQGGSAPFAAEAEAALARMVQGRKVTLSQEGQPSKSGWLRAQLFAGPGLWVQGELVSNGFARVRTFPDRRECATELLSREARARAAKKGLWALPAYAVRGPETVSQVKGSFGLVEGTVAATANVGGRVFVNFGQDYRTDFTVHIKPDTVKLFAQAGLNPETLEGKRVRVRGYVRENNGPVIDATAPEQIEVLK